MFTPHLYDPSVSIVGRKAKRRPSNWSLPVNPHDARNLILEKVYDKKEKHARIFVASLYIQAINDANESLKKRFKSFNWCAYRTAMVLFLAFALHFLNLFITKAAS